MSREDAIKGSDEAERIGRIRERWMGETTITPEDVAFLIDVADGQPGFQRGLEAAARWHLERIQQLKTTAGPGRDQKIAHHAWSEKAIRSLTDKAG